MKHFTHSFIIFLLFAFTNVQAQVDFYITPTVYTETYVPLENATNLTEDLPGWGWEQDSFLFELPTPVHLAGNVDLTHIQIETLHGLARILSNNSDYFAGILVTPFDGFFVDPLNDPINTDKGDVLYKYENNISTIEYRNVASAIETIIGPIDNLVSRFNFQIEIHHITERIRFIYGPSEISEDLQNAFDNIITVPSTILIATENIFPNPMLHIVLATGNPNNPVFETYYDLSEINEDSISYLGGFPESGTVYDFAIDHVYINSTDNIHASGFKIFPNPALDQLNISIDETIHDHSNAFNVAVIDLTGSVKKLSKFETNVSLDVSNLAAGMYILQIEQDGKTFNYPWIKQ